MRVFVIEGRVFSAKGIIDYLKESDILVIGNASSLNRAPNHVLIDANVIIVTIVEKQLGIDDIKTLRHRYPCSHIIVLSALASIVDSDLLIAGAGAVLQEHDAPKKLIKVIFSLTDADSNPISNVQLPKPSKNETHISPYTEYKKFEQYGKLEQVFQAAIDKEDFQAAIDKEDFELSAEIVELTRDQLFKEDEWRVLESWIALIPQETLQNRLVLLLTQAYIAFFLQNIEQLIYLIGDIESKFEEQTMALRYSVELRFFKGIVHFWLGNISASEAELLYVAEHNPVIDSLLSAEVEVHLALVYYFNHKQDLAKQRLNKRIQVFSLSNRLAVPKLLASLAILNLLSSDLVQLRVTLARMEQTLISTTSRFIKGWFYYLKGLCYFHSGQLAFSVDALEKCEPYITLLDTRAQLDATAVLILVRKMLGKPQLGGNALYQFKKLTYRLTDEQYISVFDSCEARINLYIGNINCALTWAINYQDEGDDNLLNILIWQESPLVTKTKILITAGGEHLPTAQKLIQRLQIIGEKHNLLGMLIDVFVLKSVLLNKLNKVEQSYAVFTKVLQMIERAGGYYCSILELNDPMLRLLKRYIHAKGTNSVIEQLVLQFKDRKVNYQLTDSVLPSWQGPPLTPKETEILVLLTQRKKNKEIALLLNVSPETIKGHLKSIFQKLNVSSRYAAAEKADEILPAYQLYST